MNNRSTSYAHKPPTLTPRAAVLHRRYAALVLLAFGLGACSTGSTTKPTLQGLEVSMPGDNELIFSGVKGNPSDAQRITLRNSGDAPLELTTLELSGPDEAAFELNVPSLPLLLEPGGSAATTVTFLPEAAGNHNATLQIESSDTSRGGVAIGLYGLGSEGQQGEGEPGLQQIVDTLGYQVEVGGDGLNLGTGGEPIGDEVIVGLFERASDGPVTLSVVARYGPEGTLPYGFYTLAGSKPALREVGSIAAQDAQELLPPVATGGGSFDPGTQAFGIYASVGDGTRYTLDALNRGELSHALRVYPLRDRAGNPVPDSYLIGLEEAANGDYQDALFVLGNVRPSGTALPDLQALEGWESLFNGTDLSGWYSYLPSQGRNRDPEGVFRVENGMLHILGVEDKGTREFGYIGTEKSYANYHLRLEYRWGSKRFAPRATNKRDSGVVYHVTGRDKVWPQGVEYQIQEGDTGDFWLLGGPTMTTTVASVQPQEPQYEQNGTPYTSRRGDYVRIIKDGTHENVGDWNTVDLIVRGDSATHLINGRVNNRAYSLHTPSGAALTSGRILLQAEGAEVFYRNIQIRPLEGP